MAGILHPKTFHMHWTHSDTTALNKRRFKLTSISWSRNISLEATFVKHLLWLRLSPFALFLAGEINYSRSRINTLGPWCLGLCFKSHLHRPDYYEKNIFPTSKVFQFHCFVSFVDVTFLLMFARSGKEVVNTDLQPFRFFSACKSSNRAR